QPTVLSELEQSPEFEKLWHVTLELNSSWLKDNIYGLQLTKAQIQPVITKSEGLAAECFRSRFELLSKVSLDAPDYYVTRQPCLTLVKDWDDVLYNSDNFREIVRSVFTDQFLGTMGDDANFFGWDNALAKIV